jgi:hypothetical protein
MLTTLARPDVPVQMPSERVPRWLRSLPARVVVAVLAAGIIAALAVLPMALVVAEDPAQLLQTRGQQITVAQGLRVVAGTSVGAAVALGLYALFVRLTERRAVTELSLRGAGRETAVGLLISAAMMTTVIGLIAATGNYRLTGVGSVGSTLAVLGIAGLFAGVVEEVIFRAIVFRVLEEWLGSWTALVVSAAIFGALHLGNADATVWGAVAIALEAGIMLGVMYMLTRRLWLVMAVHAGWNFVQGGVFGADVSGTGAEDVGLVTEQLTGPVWLSGGGFGPEASVFAVLLGVGVAVVFLRAAIARGRVLAPIWSRSPRAVFVLPGAGAADPNSTRDEQSTP